jgi:hypothetical protein
MLRDGLQFFTPESGSGRDPHMTTVGTGKYTYTVADVLT